MRIRIQGVGNRILAGTTQQSSRIIGIAITLLIVFGLVALDLRTSWAESRILSIVARRAAYSVKPGPSRALDHPADGPYDERLGYSRLPRLIAALDSAGFRIQSQTSDSFTLRTLSQLGLDPIYREKDQAGLQVLDRGGRTLYASPYPRRIYSNFAAIPPLVVRTVLFIENRQMLDARHPYRDPAIQWGRFVRAMFDESVHMVDHKHPRAGGSTLATQLEKMRHSPKGRTDSVFEKGRQMFSAALRAYRSGPATIDAQRQIVCDYINSIPLSATSGQGEVAGLADGLRDWYGENFTTVNALLSAKRSRITQADQIRQAKAYREVLSLFLALRAPTEYLSRNPEALTNKTDRYLGALYRNHVISASLYHGALEVRSMVRPHAAPEPPVNFTANKASSAIRVSMLKDLGLDDEYSLDRLDMTVRTTLDAPAERSVSRFLTGLSDQTAVKAAGLDQYQLLNQGSPGSVIYSVTIYQPDDHANLLRVQTDNFNQPLDINQGTKLQLGSTAKLRTMINYLQIADELHDRYEAMTPAQLKGVPVAKDDNLTAWAIDYLSKTGDKGLEPMLEAALQRKYSGANGEAFFTAGGLHHFDNFEKSENEETMTVSEAFQRSVNLVFIRLMRDIEHYYMFRAPGASPDVLDNANDPARQRYLDRFADFEGRKFVRRFYAKYQGQTPEQALHTLLAGIVLTPVRAAVIFRSVRPQANENQFKAFLKEHLSNTAFAQVDFQELFDKYGPDKFDLNDRSYLARVHPLELWLLNYRESHPQARLSQIITASATQREEVYRWLYKTRYKHAQDERIQTVLEIDAFKQIHSAWKKLGYPFDSLVPSYATAIGVSGDTPHALADLAGILLHDGMYYPDASVLQVWLAQSTPSETRMSRTPSQGVRLLSPEIAGLVRREMIGVVQNGTGKRAQDGLKLQDGLVLPIGGKTGTGDNRIQQFSANGYLVGSKVEDRTAAFVFFIGDRLYGTVLAFVPGKAAGNYKFTSALAVQILKDLEPQLISLIDNPRGTAQKHLVLRASIPHFG